MKAKTVKRRASAGANGKGGPERGTASSGTAATSAQQDASSRTDARVGRKLQRTKVRAPVRAQVWQLRLYVAGPSLKSLTAFENLKQFCESYLQGRYRITVIDLVQQPHLAKGDQILAIPTVVRKLPKPVRTVLGNLSDTARVLVGLDLRAC